ncbi:MAG: OprO/OprP family phosphate-selective porin, partial [Gammaproteobacteria bacterium]
MQCRCTSRRLLPLVLMALFGFPSGASATDEALLQVLLQNKLITRQQYAALAKKPDPAVNVTLKDGIKLKSVDGTSQAQVGVYFQYDAAAYSEDGTTDFSNGSELRRGRLSVAGTVLSDWDYKLELDFAGATQGGSTNTVSVTDAYLRWMGLRPWAVTAGNFKVPFSMEAVGSGKYSTFMERGLPFAFLNLRRLGGMVSTNGDNWSAAAGLFGDTVTSQSGNDEGQSAAGRLTWAPFFGTDRVLHLGIAAARVQPAQAASSGMKTVRFRSKPESNIISDGLTESATLTANGRTLGRSSGRLVDSGNIPGGVNDYILLGAEAAAVYGPASLQGEYIDVTVDRDTGGDLSFSGYYLFGSWFLTGESRNYKADRGIFDIIQPKRPFSLKDGGWGAWEVAVRFSSIDLTDGRVAGGVENDVTAGINWYPTAYTRLMVNYVDVLKVSGGAHD